MDDHGWKARRAKKARSTTWWMVIGVTLFKARTRARFSSSSVDLEPIRESRGEERFVLISVIDTR